MADVIAIDYVIIFVLSSRLMLLPDVVIDVKTTFGRCYCQVADVIATIGGVFGCVCFVSDRWNSHGSTLTYVLRCWNRTSSHMCGRWNLPTFLFRDGLLTLMNSASFIALLRFWSSLPTILKFSMLML